MIMGSFGRYPVETAHDAPMSSCVRGGLVEAPGVGVQGAVDGVGQVALEDAEAGPAGFVLVLAAAGQEGGRAGVAAGLGQGDAVQGGVELPVPAAVEAVRAVGAGAGSRSWTIQRSLLITRVRSATRSSR